MDLLVLHFAVEMKMLFPTFQPLCTPLIERRVASLSTLQNITCTHCKVKIVLRPPHRHGRVQKSLCVKYEKHTKYLHNFLTEIVIFAIFILYTTQAGLISTCRPLHRNQEGRKNKFYFTLFLIPIHPKENL